MYQDWGGFDWDLDQPRTSWICLQVANTSFLLSVFSPLFIKALPSAPVTILPDDIFTTTTVPSLFPLHLQAIYSGPTYHPLSHFLLALLHQILSLSLLHFLCLLLSIYPVVLLPYLPLSLFVSTSRLHFFVLLVEKSLIKVLSF
jgi:hypothetical protein